MRRLPAVAALGLVAFALAGCGGSKGISLPCSPQPQGHLCLKVFHDRMLVRDAIGYLAASDSQLAGKTWRLVLMSYSCEPTVCSAHSTYPGPTRHGDPPLAASCRTANGSTTTTSAGCHDTLAQAMASFGDFAGFHVPGRFADPLAWLCVAQQVRSGGTWRTAAKPASACLRVAGSATYS